MPRIALSDRIPRITLAALKRDREKLAALRAQAEALAASISEREQDIITCIEAGLPLDGDARVLTRRRQNISWLTVVRDELGESAVAQVKNEWPVTFYKALQIA